MPPTIEYRGLRALEYAAQTGAQLMRRKSDGDLALPIDPAVAHALWRVGVPHQVVCIVVDHRALAAAQPYPGWAYAWRHVLRRNQHLAQRGLRWFAQRADQLALLVRLGRQRMFTGQSEL